MALARLDGLETGRDLRDRDRSGMTIGALRLLSADLCQEVVSPLAAVPLAVLAAASSSGSLATFAAIPIGATRRLCPALR
jgi:hypothetical protein